MTNAITEDLEVRLDEEGIEIPFPHRTLYTGAVTDPFPIRIVGEASSVRKEDGNPGAEEVADA